MGGRGGPDPPPPLKTLKKLGFYSNNGPDPLKITMLQSQNPMLGHNRRPNETPFKRRFVGWSMMARL